MLPMRYQPHGSPSPFERMFDQVFSTDFFGPSWSTLARPNWAPMDVKDTAEAFEVELALPGVKPEDVDVQVHKGVLSVRVAEKAETETENNGYLVKEIRRGAVARAVQLPAEVDSDKAEATFEHGVLKLRLPKSEAAKPRSITIKS
jgi:HSP20 family protein